MVTDLGEVGEMVGDLPLMPGGEDGFDVGEVLVQGGSANAGLFGYLGHGYCTEASFGDQRRRGFECGLPY